MKYLARIASVATAALFALAPTSPAHAWQFVESTFSGTITEEADLGTAEAGFTGFYVYAEAQGQQLYYGITGDHASASVSLEGTVVTTYEWGGGPLPVQVLVNQNYDVYGHVACESITPESSAWASGSNEARGAVSTSASGWGDVWSEGVAMSPTVSWGASVMVEYLIRLSWR